MYGVAILAFPHSLHRFRCPGGKQDRTGDPVQRGLLQSPDSGPGAVHDQYAPPPRRTANRVFHRIEMSRAGDQFST